MVFYEELGSRVNLAFKKFMFLFILEDFIKYLKVHLFRVRCISLECIVL